MVAFTWQFCKNRPQRNQWKSSYAHIQLVYSWPVTQEMFAAQMYIVVRMLFMQKNHPHFSTERHEARYKSFLLFRFPRIQSCIDQYSCTQCWYVHIFWALGPWLWIFLALPQVLLFLECPYYTPGPHGNGQLEWQIAALF